MKTINFNSELKDHISYLFQPEYFIKKKYLLRLTFSLQHIMVTAMCHYLQNEYKKPILTKKSSSALRNYVSLSFRTLYLYKKKC